jgi:hypothetical protein
VNVTDVDLRLMSDSLVLVAARLRWTMPNTAVFFSFGRRFAAFWRSHLLAR